MREGIVPGPEQGNKVTKLIIESEPQDVLHQSRNISGEARKLSVGRNIEQGYDYYNLSNLSRTEHIRVFMREADGLKPIRLPEKMLERIAQYFRERGGMAEDLDCSDFVNYVNEVSYTRGEFPAHSYTPYLLADESHLSPGDTILLSPREEINTLVSEDLEHFAIYLDDGLYLSKGGRRGVLAVTDLDTMKKLYECKTAVVLVKKER